MNRVKLLNPINGCDYVNASWITFGKHNKDVPCSNISFMACQGPTQQTAPHHWQTIFENNVDIIIMLTKFREKKDKGNILINI